MVVFAPHALVDEFVALFTYALGHDVQDLLDKEGVTLGLRSGF